MFNVIFFTYDYIRFYHSSFPFIFPSVLVVVYLLFLKICAIHFYVLSKIDAYIDFFLLFSVTFLNLLFVTSKIFLILFVSITFRKLLFFIHQLSLSSTTPHKIQGFLIIFFLIRVFITVFVVDSFCFL